MSGGSTYIIPAHTVCDLGKTAVSFLPAAKAEHTLNLGLAGASKHNKIH